MKHLPKRLQFKSQAGNIGIIAAIVIVAGLFLWQIWKPQTLSHSSLSADRYCLPEENGEVVMMSPFKNTPSWPLKAYRKIKTDTLIDPWFTSRGRLTENGYKDGTVHLVESPLADTGGINKKLYYYHYDQGNEGSGSPGTLYFTDGTSRPWKINDLVDEHFSNREDKLMALMYLTDEKPIMIDGNEFWSFDIYLRTDIPMPDYIKNCADHITSSTRGIKITPGINVTMVPGTPFPTDNTIQIQSLTATYSAIRNIVPSWLDPHCKPIIYLYPPQKEDVSVKLNPKGYLTESIPQYPKDGWLVTAYPDGTIDYKNKTYPYLYYESKILDSETKVPQEGFVRKAGEMKQLFAEILPKLGLNEKEAQAFSDYWLKALPKAPYYFVGIMDEAAIDHIEPLTISPKPDTIIRVRTYFKALEKPIDVTEPRLDIAVERNGFSVVEWGGMVKRDANHPFTCSE